MTSLWAIILLHFWIAILSFLFRLLSNTSGVQISQGFVFLYISLWLCLNTGNTWASFVHPQLLPIWINLVWIWRLKACLRLLHPNMMQVLDMMVHCLLAKVWVRDKGFWIWLWKSLVDNDFVKVVCHCILVWCLIWMVCLITAHVYLFNLSVKVSFKKIVFFEINYLSFIS